MESSSAQAQKPARLLLELFTPDEHKDITQPRRLHAEFQSRGVQERLSHVESASAWFKRRKVWYPPA
jgi:hypothetical protein